MEDINKILQKKRVEQFKKRTVATRHQLLALDIASDFKKGKDKKSIAILMRLCKLYPANYIQRIWDITREKNPSNKMAYFLGVLKNMNEETKADRGFQISDAKSRILFIGTSEFAVPALNALVKKFVVAAVITQPDRPVGRKQVLTPSPVKVVAGKHKLSIWQPRDIKTIASKIKKLKPDVTIVASYGQMIPQTILDTPRHGSLNIHGSLLPLYRGASPVNAVIRDGRKTTGVTIMEMDAKLDHGPIVIQAKIKLKDDITAGILHDQLARLGARTLVKILPAYLTGAIKSSPQNHQQASYTTKLKRVDGEVNWQQTAIQIERQIRAYDPWPGSFCFVNKKRLKILSVRIWQKNAFHKNVGTFFSREKQLVVYCRRGSLILEKVRPEGKRVTGGYNFWTNNNLSNCV